nr:hypothetical protein 1137p_00104 [Serratia proteamaculans]
MEVTAKFSPDLNNPTKNQFINTTPISGFCSRWPSYCVHDVQSIATTLTTKQQYVMKAWDTPRNSAYFGFPSAYRTVEVVNTVTGEKNTLKFRIAGFSARNWNASNSNWDRTWGLYPPSPCVSGTSIGGGSWIQFAWSIPPKSNVNCVMRSKIDRNPNITFDEISYAYELISPNPLVMGSGIYNGSVRLEIGPYKDIDFGDNFIANDNFLDVFFSLTVNHELKVTSQAGARDVTLYPCYYGADCRKEDAEKNWERWMVTNIPPQKMSGTSQFTLSSSGSFTVYMACGSGSALSQESCPLLSDKSSTVVPVKALLTLPDNISDSTGKKVVNRPLKTEKNKSQDKFLTTSFGTDRPGQVDFVIDKKNIIEMLKSRPDNWSGSITLIFDPKLY